MSELNILSSHYTDENYYVILSAYERLYESLTPQQRCCIFKKFGINIYRDYDCAIQTRLKTWLKFSQYTGKSLQKLIFDKNYPFKNIKNPQFIKLLELYSYKPRLPRLPQSRSINTQLCQLRKGYTNMFPLNVLMEISYKYNIPLDELIL